MGRMDDARRRARKEEGVAPEPVPLTQQSSPWGFGDDEPRPAPVPAPARPHAVEPPEVPNEAPRPRRRLLEPARESARDFGVAVPETARLVASSESPPILGEQFRHLAATLHRAQESQKIKTLMVTSASAGDGKSLTAANLALTLGESYKRRVLLIDADLRRPSLHRLFGFSNGAGLSDGLAANGDAPLVLAQVSERLTLLPAGRPQPDPMGGLSSPRMRHIIEEAAERFDWVIIDTPPVGLLADASVLTGMVDGALLVVRAGVTAFPEVEAAAATLGREHILGVVLNAAAPSDIGHRGYYHYYYHRRGHADDAHTR
jgi:capsular exopolysaccharide synthesis family protein